MAQHKKHTFFNALCDGSSNVHEFYIYKLYELKCRSFFFMFLWSKMSIEFMLYAIWNFETTKMCQYWTLFQMFAV